MIKRVLSVLLALVLMFSAIAEETPQAEKPVEEVTIEQEEAQDETDTESGAEEVEEKPAERCVEVVSETVTIPAVETATENVSEVTVNEPRQENQTESLPSDIQVDDKGSTEPVLENGTEQKEVSASEETLEIESKGEGKDIQISEQGDLVDDIKDESTEEKQTVQEVPEEDTEEADENTGVDDDTTEQTSETESKLDAPLDEEDATEAEDADTDIVQEPEEKVNEDVLGEQPVESVGESTGDEAEEEAEEAEEVDVPDAEEVESEDEGMADGSKVETEADSKIETVEELDGSTVDDVSEWNSVLTFAMPVMAMSTSQAYVNIISGRPDNDTIWANEATDSNVITFSIDSDDKYFQYDVKINDGDWIYGWDGVERALHYSKWTKSGTFTITYKELYSKMTADGYSTITIHVHNNKLGTGVSGSETTFRFYKAVIDEPKITIERVGTGDVYPGDELTFKANCTLTSGGIPITGTTKYTTAIVWVIDGEVYDNGDNRIITWTATDYGEHTVYAILHVYY